ARRPPGRRLSARSGARARTPLQHRARHGAGRGGRCRLRAAWSRLVLKALRWFAGAAVVLALGAGLFLLSKASCLQLVGDFACRVETSERLVALTFDHGPTPRGVDAVLPVLRDKGGKATFFLVGQALERHPG